MCTYVCTYIYVYKKISLTTQMLHHHHHHHRHRRHSFLSFWWAILTQGVFISTWNLHFFCWETFKDVETAPARFQFFEGLPSNDGAWYGALAGGLDRCCIAWVLGIRRSSCRPIHRVAQAIWAQQPASEVLAWRGITHRAVAVNISLRRVCNSMFTCRQFWKLQDAKQKKTEQC